MMELVKDHKIEIVIVPSTLIYKRKVYKIEKIDKKYFIKHYKVKTFKNKIYSVVLETPHPNCNPSNKEFCLPIHLIGEELNNTATYKIETMLRTFNLDGCYFKPWDELRYIKN